ncbi:MAG: hypothetical protein F7C81_03305 [Desulfurococcales archaeon]|nr:hypothetical protein [Desulfurococcales archaeon]MEB3780596.1 hypothetical protein [Desulfurococcales archaeon]
MRYKVSEQVLHELRLALAYQFDYRVAEALLPTPDRVSIRYSKKGKIKEVWLDDELLLVRRPNDGFFSISLRAAQIIISTSNKPKYRIIVKGDRELKGSVLARDVVEVDPDLRPGDEVVIVDVNDNIIGVGRLRVSPIMLIGLEKGEIARVRKKSGA